MGLAFSNNRFFNEKSLFYLLIIASLLPIWACTYVPTQDGPTHLENANIILNLISSTDHIYNDYFSLNYSTTSNWLLQLILAALILFFPILIAEKLILSGFVIFFPLSFRYCLNSINHENSFLSFLSIGFIYSYTFCMGFHSFSYSMILYFFSFGYWLRYIDRKKSATQKTLFMSFLFLVTYLLHVLSFVMLFAAICIYLGVEVLYIDRFKEKRAEGIFTSLVKNFSPLLVSVLPTAILLLLFFQNSGSSMEWDYSILIRIKRLLTLFSLVCYDKLEILFSGVLVILIGSLVLYSLFNKYFASLKNILTGPFVLVIFYLTVYFLAPDSISGGSLINDRLSLYFFLIVILWAGTFKYKPRLRSAVIFFSILISLVSLSQKSIKISEINVYLKDYVAGTELIPTNSTVLPLSYFHSGACLSSKETVSYRINPLTNAAGYIAAQRNCVELSNYQADTSYFPTQWKQYRNPYIYIGKVGFRSATIDLQSYSRNIDYVIISCLRIEQLKEAPIISLFKQLNESYKMIYQSKYKTIYQLNSSFGTD